MKCPHCSYCPKLGGKRFEHIKTQKFTDSVMRGYKCPKCKRSFRTYETPTKEPYYKRDMYASD